jgi:hypothetical protein
LGEEARTWTSRTKGRTGEDLGEEARTCRAKGRAKRAKRVEDKREEKSEERFSRGQNKRDISSYLFPLIFDDDVVHFHEVDGEGGYGRAGAGE